MGACGIEVLFFVHFRGKDERQSAVRNCGIEKFCLEQMRLVAWNFEDVISSCRQTDVKEIPIIRMHAGSYVLQG